MMRGDFVTPPRSRISWHCRRDRYAAGPTFGRIQPDGHQACPRVAEEAPDHSWFGDGGSPVVLSVGRPSREKDFLTLIEAFHRVLPQYPCRLVVLGQGPMRAELEDRIHELGLEEHVSLPGRVDNPFAFMSRAALFVLSSLHEGLGNVLVEGEGLRVSGDLDRLPGRRLRGSAGSRTARPYSRSLPRHFTQRSSG